MNYEEFPVLYPFGFDSGDTSHQKLELEDDACVNIAVTTDIVFYNSSYSDRSIYVSTFFL